LLARVLAACEVEGIAESRRAGGAFCLHADERDRLDRIRALWRLTVGLAAPGLAFTDTDPGEATAAAEPDPAFADRPEIAALRAAYRSQPGLRENTAAMLLPAGQPVTEADRRTGRVAVATETKGGEGVRLDGVVAPQRDRGRQIAQAAAQDRLALLFLPQDAAQAAPYRFPRQFDPAEADRGNPAFPFGGHDRRVAVVHADISGLGQTFRSVTRHATTAAQVRAVATAIEAAVAQAARGASAAVLLPEAVGAGTTGEERERYAALFGRDSANPPVGLGIVPARPVILGGDDITVLVRADLALAFAAELLTRIEDETAKALTPFAALKLPARLTACAGIAIVGDGHPFRAGNLMAEGLCKAAKQVVKTAANGRIPSSAIAFAVVTSSLEEDFKSWRAREQVLFETPDPSDPSGPKTIPTFASAGPYLVGSGAAGAPVEALLKLAEALEAAEGRGKLIEAIALRRNNPAAAQDRYGRFLEVLGDSGTRAALEGALDALSVARGAMDAALPYLNDALEVLDIGTLAAAWRRAARAATRTEA
jgi:hypothetical protein